MNTLLHVFQVNEIGNVSSNVHSFIPGCPWAYYTVYNNTVTIYDWDDKQLCYITDIDNYDVIGLYAKTLPGTYKAIKIWDHRADTKINMSHITSYGWLPFNRVFNIDDLMVDEYVTPAVIRSFPEYGGIILLYKALDRLCPGVYVASRWMGNQETIESLSKEDLDYIFLPSKLDNPSDMIHTIGIHRNLLNGLVEINIFTSSNDPSQLVTEINCAMKHINYFAKYNEADKTVDIFDNRDDTPERVNRIYDIAANELIAFDYNEITKRLRRLQ